MTTQDLPPPNKNGVVEWRLNQLEENTEKLTEKVDTLLTNLGSIARDVAVIKARDQVKSETKRTWIAPVATAVIAGFVLFILNLLVG